MTLSWHDLVLTPEAALGAEVIPYVGAEADLTRLDPVATANARIPVAALGLDVGAAGGLHATVRIEEGIVHAGGLESVEAHVGWEHPAGWAGAWVGRRDLALTRDREMEGEALIFPTRPTLSRASLPVHANGAGVLLAVPDRARLTAGVAWTTTTADAPWLWLRLAAHPLGPLPEWQDEPAEALRVQLGGGAAHLASEGLGAQWVLTADLAARWRTVSVDAGWTEVQTTDAPGGDVRRDGLVAEVGTRVAPLPVGDLHLAARGEHLTGLEPGEDARWIGAGRLAWRSEHRRAEVYLFGQLSRESGTGVAPGEDAVGLPGGAERANDLAGLGMLLRL